MTTYYVTHDGPNGDGSGDSVANSMSLQGAADAVTAGHTVYICNTGTYALGSTRLDFDTNNGTYDAPIFYLGRTADGSAPELVLLTCSSSCINSATTFCVYDHIGVVSTYAYDAAWKVQPASDGNLSLYNCTAKGAGNGFNVFTNHIHLVNCTAWECGAHGFGYAHSVFDSNYLGCVARDCDGDGWNAGGGNLISCVAHGNTGRGVYFAEGTAYAHQTSALVNCTIADNDGDGLYVDSATSQQPYVFLVNTILARNGGYGVNASAERMMNVVGCFIPGSGADTNVSGSTHNVLPADTVLAPTLTSGVADFASVAAGSEDYTIGDASVCKAAGWPGDLGVGTGYPDIGAVQRAEPAEAAGPTLGPVVAGAWR